MTLPKKLSQRTLVEVMRVLEEYGTPGGEMDEPPVNFTQFLYENDFQGWFIKHAQSFYDFNWQKIIIGLRDGSFFFPSFGWSDNRSNITGEYLSHSSAVSLGEHLNRRLAALAFMTPRGEPVRRSLELDGFRVNEKTLDLIPVESVVSEQEEEDRLALLIQRSGITSSAVILKHLRDAHDLFVQGKDHPSIGEDRNFVQAVIDNIGAETDAHGGHLFSYPGGMKNRLKYLHDVGFFTPDERAAFESAWGFLSAGSHPGIPSREEARIALILSLEFGSLLLLKFANWSTNGYKQFS